MKREKYKKISLFVKRRMSIKKTRIKDSKKFFSFLTHFCLNQNLQSNDRTNFQQTHFSNVVTNFQNEYEI